MLAALEKRVEAASSLELLAEEVKLVNEAAKHLKGKFTEVSKTTLALLHSMEEKEGEKESQAMFDELSTKDGLLTESDHQSLLQLLGRQPALSESGLKKLRFVMERVAEESLTTWAKMSEQGPVVKEQIAFQSASLAAFQPLLSKLPAPAQRFHGSASKISDGLARLLEAMSDVLQFPDTKSFLNDDKGGRRSNFLMRSVTEFQSLLDTMTSEDDATLLRCQKVRREPLSF